MIRLAIDERRLGKLFPAFLQVDSSGSIIKVGPSLQRQLPDLSCPADLADHFRFQDDPGQEGLAGLAHSGNLVTLVARAARIRLNGSVLALDGGHLLALRHIPSQFSLGADNLQMSDFGPEDPMVPGLMLVGLQKALIEESQVTAGELARERQRSDDLLERLSRMAGFMAHDFNNFLSIIRLNAERIDDVTTTPGRNRRLAGIIAETAERASDITRSLMTLSRQRFDSRLPLEPDALIAENQPFFRTLLGTRIRLELELGAPEQRIETSRVALLNSIVNLLINARDAMPDGGCVRIVTSVRQARLAPAVRKPDPALRDYLAIVISDSGAGMDPEVLARAFEPLFSTKPHGNGIGLASVLDFAREMGGDACIDSRPGEGTSLYIYLPVLSAAQALSSTQSLPARTQDEQAARILLVEDEPYALEALTEMLGDQGFRVTACGSAPEARRALAEEAGFDILLTDIVLAEEDGLALGAEACDRHPELKVIAMSGYVPESSTMPADWGFVRKPIDGRALKDMLCAALTTRR